MEEFKKQNLSKVREETIPSSEKEVEFRDAMKKRQYDNALDLMMSILEEDKKAIIENGGDIFHVKQNDLNQNHLEMARKLALKYFEHKKSLKAIWKLYELFYCSINIVPEAQEKDSELCKVLKLEYEQALARRINNSAYELGKIGGLLNKDEYKKLFDIAVDKNDVGAAHDYAMEGGLYNTTDSQIKSWLDELELMKEKLVRFKTRREEEHLGLKEFMDKYGEEFKSLDKHRKDIKELLVASVE